MSLSDNEKAATFIGWTPGSISSSWDASRVSPDGLTWSSQPDMSAPRNYMKALEGLIARNLSMCIGYRWVIIHDRHGLNLAEADTNGNIGMAAMKALAALYDAEHPEPDHGSV